MLVMRPTDIIRYQPSTIKLLLLHAHVVVLLSSLASLVTFRLREMKSWGEFFAHFKAPRAWNTKVLDEVKTETVDELELFFPRNEEYKLPCDLKSMPVSQALHSPDLRALLSL